MGLQLESHESGVQITGMPAEGESSPTLLIEAVLEDDGNELPGISRAERVAAQMAKSMAIRSGKILEPKEMGDLLDRLFGCSTPDRDPFGRRVIVNFDAKDIDKRFQ
jgi:DNA mismatch repair protein MutL